MQADAVVEAKLKMSDINCALVLCSLIHQRYADFSGLLLESWQKVLLTKKDDKVCYLQLNIRPPTGTCCHQLKCLTAS